MIPLLHDAAAAGSPRLVEESEVDDMIVARTSMCPHPGKTVCIRVSGDSMSPILENGYIVAIDTAETDHRRLYNHMVAARDPEGGVTIKWFRNHGGEEMLIPQHTSTRYPPVLIGRDQWKIIGKVLWWIGMPPPAR